MDRPSPLSHSLDYLWGKALEGYGREPVACKPGGNNDRHSERSEESPFRAIHPLTTGLDPVGG